MQVTATSTFEQAYLSGKGRVSRNLTSGGLRARQVALAELEWTARLLPVMQGLSRQAAQQIQIRTRTADLQPAGFAQSCARL